MRATSSGLPCRLRLVREMIRRWVTSSSPCSGQRIAPGATAFTRTSGPRSRARARVSITTPALVIEYTACSRRGESP